MRRKIDSNDNEKYDDDQENRWFTNKEKGKGREEGLETINYGNPLKFQIP